MHFLYYLIEIPGKSKNIQPDEEIPDNRIVDETKKDMLFYFSGPKIISCSNMKNHSTINISISKNRLLIALLVMFSQVVNIQAQQDAFPGAEGFGRHAAGGRGGDVCHVINDHNLRAGLYFIKVTDSSQKIYTQKLLIK